MIKSFDYSSTEDIECLYGVVKDILKDPANGITNKAL